VITGIVLAAGTSSRLGRPKQLLDLGGTPVLRHVVNAALASPLDEVVVVLGHLAGEIAVAVPATDRVRTVVNARYSLGQSTSLAAGLAAAATGSEAAVVMLGDQPAIRPDAVAAVVGAFVAGGGPVVQASYGGRHAHPTLFAREVWAELVRELEGDQGARDVLERHPEWRSPIEVGGDPPLDIDTERDYERVRAGFDPEAR
jgi:CTP:molybdopterin cytidylyltransferase MocA